MSSAELEGLGLEEGLQAQDSELGMPRLHPSYPASLEREGFVGSSATYASNSLSGSPRSPAFEMKERGPSTRAGGAVPVATAAAVAMPGSSKALILGNSSGGSGGGGSSGISPSKASPVATTETLQSS